MDRLHMLLSLLTTGMHAACPGSKVIWYDSVTVQGQLKWQNEVNSQNKPFFDLCDGIFLNYNWSERGLASSQALAGERRGEVYVGVDVFGRGCYGGGGFNSYKAVEVISRHVLSCALFAPGWVYETQDKHHFFQNQERFWSLLTPWIHSTSVSSLPLVTSFGRGYGESMNINGKVVHRGPWTYHSAQDIQLTVPSLSALVTASAQESAVKLDSVVLDTSKAYNNGVSLKFIGSTKFTQGMNKPALVRLFKSHMKVSSPLLVAFTYNCDQHPTCSVNHHVKVYLQLHTSGTPSRVFLDTSMATPVKEDSAHGAKSTGYPKSSRIPSLPGCVLAPLSQHQAKSIHKIFTGSWEQIEPWNTKYYIIDPSDLQSALIQEITLGFYLAGSRSAYQNTLPTREPFSLTIGEIKILSTDCLTANYEVVNIWSHSYKCSEDRKSVSFTLSWITSDNETDPIEHCNIYSSACIPSTSTSVSPWRSEYMYRGRAYANSFRLTNLYLLKEDSDDSATFSFVVQAVTVSQRKMPVSESPSLTIELCL